MFPIKYIDNNLVWNEDNEVFAYYELIPYNYSFLSAEQKFIVKQFLAEHDLMSPLFPAPHLLLHESNTLSPQLFDN